MLLLDELQPLIINPSTPTPAQSKAGHAPGERSSEITDFCRQKAPRKMPLDCLGEAGQGWLTASAAALPRTAAGSWQA